MLYLLRYSKYLIKIFKNYENYLLFINKSIFTQKEILVAVNLLVLYADLLRINQLMLKLLLMSCNAYFNKVNKPKYQ